MHRGVLRSLTWLTFMAGIASALLLAWDEPLRDQFHRPAGHSLSIPGEPTAAGPLSKRRQTAAPPAGPTASSAR